MNHRTTTFLVVGILPLLASACGPEDGNPTFSQTGPVITYQPTTENSETAQLVGTLVMDGQCLRVATEPEGGSASEMWTVILPEATWDEENQVLTVDDTTFELDSRVSFGGGYQEPGTLADQPELPCLTEDYFLVGPIN